MDPVRSDLSAPDSLSGPERDARIEQLLLSGLDHYFAADYDQAINLWTRVLFLDRHHDRARAYIDRARAAQAERQRESEAVLHQGIEAFQAGDIDRARALLQQALEQGASRDVALGVLGRIDRLGVSASAAKPRPKSSWTTRVAPPPLPAPSAAPRRAWAGGTLLILAALGAAAVGVWGIALPDLRALPFVTTDTRSEISQAVPLAAEPLPLPAATEAFLSRGQSLFNTGRLRDALQELERIPYGDPLRSDADRLRARIQRELLAVAAATPAAPPASEPPRE